MTMDLGSWNEMKVTSAGSGGKKDSSIPCTTKLSHPHKRWYLSTETGIYTECNSM